VGYEHFYPQAIFRPRDPGIFATRADQPETTSGDEMKKAEPAVSTASGAASDADAPLPHDRDESSHPVKEDGQHRHNREPIEQARRDVESGIKDTERIGTPNDVPTSRHNRR
jgi:hypothetical protein